MATNADINRLSLDDRVKALENRLPSGGSIGGVPFLDTTVIESLRTNEFVRVNGGWAVKCEIPDTGAVTGSSLRNMSLKTMFFFPEVDGVVFAPSEVVVRAEVKSPFTITSSSHTLSYEFTPPDLSFFEAAGISLSGVVPNMFVMPGMKFAFLSGNSYVDTQANFTLARTIQTKIRVYLSIYAATTTQKPQKSPCVACSVFFSPLIPIGSLTSLGVSGRFHIWGGIQTLLWGTHGLHLHSLQHTHS